jgi:peptidoglycan/LPS O-acetylase OafA/YrhL
MQIRNNDPSISEVSPYNRHLPALDGIRGIAVVAVACSHLFPANPHSALQSFLHEMLAFGSNGVDLFFVLSGFLITGILYDSLGDTRFFRKFYARRILRIFPLYYAVLSVFALAALIFGLDYHHQLLSLALYLQNTTLIAQRIRSYSGANELPLPHFWSLAVEEQFYLVWPITVFLMRGRRRLLIFCAAALLVCPLLRYYLLLHGVNYYVVSANTLCRADSLLAGAALALLFRSRFRDQVVRAGSWIFAIGAISKIVLVYSLDRGPLLNSLDVYRVFLVIDFSAIAIASSGLIVLALSAPRVTSLCTLQPLRWLGKYSYGIYVLHLIIFSYLDEPFRGFCAGHISDDKGLNILITGIAIFFISLIAAYISYNLFERHFLRLKRYFDYRPHPDTVS